MNLDWSAVLYVCCSEVEEAVSRGLDNLGRVYARMGEFEKAIKV